MLEKIKTSLSGLLVARGNIVFKNEMLEDATTMFNAGFDSLEDGIVIFAKGKNVMVKQGNKAITYAGIDFRINMGKLIGDLGEILQEKEITEDKKEQYLAQTIVTKYNTIPGM